MVGQCPQIFNKRFISWLFACKKICMPQSFAPTSKYRNYKYYFKLKFKRKLLKVKVRLCKLILNFDLIHLFGQPLYPAYLAACDPAYPVISLKLNRISRIASGKIDRIDRIKQMSKGNVKKLRYSFA